MSNQTAQKYFEVSDAGWSSPEDIADLFSEDAVLKSPREGIFRGREAIKQFYELNQDFFETGSHHMTNFFVDGNTVVCEGTIRGKTTAGREYEGIGLDDVMEFNEEDQITSLRVYLDYSGILSELPTDVPSYS